MEWFSCFHTWIFQLIHRPSLMNFRLKLICQRLFPIQGRILAFSIIKLRINIMEKEHQSYPNKIQISQFGALFLRQLPQQLAASNTVTDDEKQNRSVSTLKLKRRGLGVNFQDFASHTQTMIHQEVNTLFRVKTQITEVTETKRKQILHHNNWINEQKLIQHKLSDAHARLQQAKYSEYDWKKQRQSLKKIRCDILNDWETIHLTRQKRMKSKLRNLLDKKYPKRSQSGLIRLTLKKK